jgi:phage shock protein C
MEKGLARSRTNRWVAGVCGGIAEYTGIPAIFIRLLWLAIAALIWIPGPFIVGILLYILAWMFIPETPERKTPDSSRVIDVEYEVKE